MPADLLVRYGAIPEVGRFACHVEPTPSRGVPVVIQTPRGMELGTVLEAVRPKPNGAGGHAPAEPVEELAAQRVLHPASADDLAAARTLREAAQGDFDQWRQRIADWKLELELLDLEWTLDRQKLLLYVLGGRGPETTRLALLAAAAGLSVVEVQPVGAEGLVPVKASSGGGCGSGGGGCGCSH